MKTEKRIIQQVVAGLRIKITVKRRDFRVGTSGTQSLRECCLHYLGMGKADHSLPGYTDNI